MSIPFTKGYKYKYNRGCLQISFFSDHINQARARNQVQDLEKQNLETVMLTKKFVIVFLKCLGLAKMSIFCLIRSFDIRTTRIKNELSVRFCEVFVIEKLGVDAFLRPEF